MWVCPGLSLPKHGAFLQLTGVGATEWQAPESKMYACGRSRGIKNGGAGVYISGRGAYMTDLESMGAAGKE